MMPAPKSRPRASAFLLAVLVAASAAAGCKHAPVVTPPPPPLRPEPAPAPPPKAAAKTDCDPPRLGRAEQPMTYAERAPRIQEAQALAVEGTGQLRAAEGPDLDPKSREQMITDAVSTLIAAL